MSSLQIEGFEVVLKEELNPLVFCKTCGKIVTNPMCTCKRSDIHCFVCVSNRTSCPTCEKDPHFREAFLVSEILDEVNVYCSNKKVGCKWIGIKGNGMNHRNNECSFFICSGKDNGCVWKGKKNNLSEHEVACGFVVIDCPKNCSKKILRKNIESHRNECKVVIIEKMNEEKRRIEEKKNNYQKQMKEIEEQRKTIQQNVKIVFSEKVHPKEEDNIVLNVRGNHQYINININE